MNPSKFKPKIMITEAKSNITIGEAMLVNALPVIAHITPIILNTVDNPSEKEII